jgi:hypothetical protein
MKQGQVNFFVPIAPVVNATAATPRKVAGVLTLEVQDKANGWIFDYTASKQYFQEWFAEIHNATDGKSWGNVRLMHQLRVAGKICEEPIFDDVNKVINCVVEVTDDEVWEMIQNGTLCGFSFSGIKVPPSQDVLAQWANLPDGKNRYVGRPFEVSFVDNPNQTGAYWKILSNAATPGSFESILNTSFFQLASLAETLADLQWSDVGPELQEDFNKYVNGLIGIIQKMARNLKDEHKELHTPPTYENAAQGDESNMDAKEFETIMNTVVGGDAFKTVIQNAVSTQVAGLVTEIATIKTQVDGLATTIQTNVEASVKTQIETVANTVTELTKKLEKTPAETTVVSRDGDNKDATVFNAALSNPDLSKEDQAALTLINQAIAPRKEAAK